MSIKGISFRHAGFITSRSIFKGAVDINLNNSEKCKIGVLLLDFELEIRVEHFTSV